MPFRIVRNNIAEVTADAIVNTANPRPVIGAGADTAIHDGAGPQLLEARKKIGDIPRGGAAITPAFNLSAKYVIHTVGPVWQDGSHGEADILRACYRNSLELAEEYGCESIAFPLISAGNYGFPKDLALQTAISAISEFLMESEMMVTLVVFDRKAYQLSEKLFTDVKSYIDENLIEEVYASEYRSAALWEWDEEDEERSYRERRRSRDLYNRYEENICCSFDLEEMEEMPAPPPAPSFAIRDAVCSSTRVKERTLEDVLRQLEESFSEALVRMMNERGMKAPQVYKSANISSKLFSKIVNNKEYKPSKPTALALAIGLKLNLDETRDFLGKAGFALSRSSKLDVIVQFFIENKNYDIFELEAVLFELTETTLAYYG